MHGAGNDYIFLDCMHSRPQNPSELAVRLSDRHFSVGGDGLILLCPSASADFRMEMYNADGSTGEMCGNGLRCIAKLAHDLGYVKGEKCTAETGAGIKRVKLFFDASGKVNAAEAFMGKPISDGEKIPSSFHGSAADVTLQVCGQNIKATLINIGNPHCVVFTENPAAVNLPLLGGAIENYPAFPQRINVEFVNAVNRSLLEARVWERGSGETLACGTGACAAAAAAVACGKCAEGERITVRLPGGDLSVTCRENGVYLYGRAALSFTGEIKL